MKRIAIHSVPRSGSSWVGQIFNSSPNVIFRFQPLFSYAFKDFLSPHSTKDDIELFFNNIIESEDDFLTQKESVENGIYPKFSKDSNITHIVYKEVRYHHILENMLEVDPDITVIGLIRNPYAVINSFLNAPREFRKDLGWNELEEWRYAEKKNLGRPEEFNGYEKWKEVALLFRKLKKHYPNRFYLLKYDDLLSNTMEEVEKLFGFCKIMMSDQTRLFLKDSSQNDKPDPYSVYKIKRADDAWKKSLHPQIVDEITHDLKISDLEEYLYK